MPELRTGQEELTPSAASTAATAAPPDNEPIGLKRWLAVVVTAFGIFSLVTAEQLPIGLLTSVGSALHVSEGTAGLMVTVPGVVAAIAAPLIPVLVGRMDRRVMLAGLMALMTLANVVSAIAPSFALLLASRVLVGITIGGFWSVAGSLAVRLVPERAIGRATSIIFGGVSAAAVFGVPLGTLIGGFSGWRTAFAALGGLGLLILIGLILLLPRLPAARPVDLRLLAQQFRNAGVMAGVLATFLIVTGHFAAYTFVSPALQSISGINEGWIGTLLFAFGIAGITGNFIAGPAAARNVRRTLLIITVALTVVMVVFPALGANRIGGIALLVLWGLSYGGVSVTLQTWMLKAAPDSTEAASALWVSVFNLSIAIGAGIGGVVVDAVTLSSVLWLGGVLALLTAAVVWRARKAQLA